MAKIVAEFDTVTKELTIVKNGEEVPNISSVSFYTYGDDKGYMEMTTSESDVNDGIYTYTRISANVNGEDVVQTEQRSNSEERTKSLAKKLSLRL